jgi:hypothetical protein
MLRCPCRRYAHETPAVTKELEFKYNDDTSLYVYDSNSFFPLDGLGCADKESRGNNHNFYFTTEIAVLFRYKVRVLQQHFRSYTTLTILVY